MKLTQSLMASLAVAAAVGLFPGSGRAADFDKSAGDLGRGVQVWTDNCARCHNMRDPKEFRDDQWRVTMTHMRIRAGLTGQETRDILTFLQVGN